MEKTLSEGVVWFGNPLSTEGVAARNRAVSRDIPFLSNPKSPTLKLWMNLHDIKAPEIIVEDHPDVAEVAKRVTRDAFDPNIAVRRRP